MRDNHDGEVGRGETVPVVSLEPAQFDLLAGKPAAPEMAIAEARMTILPECAIDYLTAERIPSLQLIVEFKKDVTPAIASLDVCRLFASMSDFDVQRGGPGIMLETPFSNVCPDKGGIRLTFRAAKAHDAKERLQAIATEINNPTHDRRGIKIPSESIARCEATLVGLAR